MKMSKIILLLAGVILVSGLAHAQYYQKIALATGIGPKNFAYNSDSGKIYVSNTGESTIGIIKNYSYQPCSLGSGPGEMAYNPLTRKLYVGTGSGLVYILNGDNDQLDTTLSAGTVGGNVACNPIVNKLYATSSTYGLYIYSGSTYSQLNFFTGFDGNLYYFPGQQTYVAHGSDSLIGVIDGAGDGINDTIGFSGITSSSEMAGSPEMKKLYVTLPGYNQVGIVDVATNSLITKVAVGTNPVALAYCPEYKKTYVACPGDINIWVIDSMDAASPIIAGDSVNAITYNPVSKYICFTDKNGSQMNILDPDGDYVFRWFDMPAINPAGLFADPSSGDIYVALPSAVGPGSVAIMGYDSLAPIGAAIYDVPAIINTDTITVFWSPGSDPGGSGIVAYDVYIQPDSTEPSSYTYYPPDTSAFLSLYGTDSTMYHLMVVARDSAGNPLYVDYIWQDSVYVDYSYVPAVDTTAPGFPINPTVNGFNPSLWMDSTYTSAPVGWTNPELGITRAYFKVGPAPAFPFDRTDSMTTSGGNSDTFNLPIDTLYGVYPAYVWLSDSMGNEDYNNWAVALIRRDIEAPFNTMVLPFSGDTAYSTSFQVNWTRGMDLLSGISSYRLNYRVDTSGAWNTVIDYHPDTFVVFSGAVPGHRYYFEAAAYDSAYNLEGIFYTAEDSIFVALTASDTTGPQIVSTYPADGDSVVSLDYQVYINFSEPVDTLSFRFHCAPDPGGWSRGWGFNNDYLMLSHNNLLPGTVYTITVDSLADSSGNLLAAGPAPNPWSFSTKPSVNLSTIWQGGVYSLFSIPLQSADSSASIMLGDDLGAYGPSGWLMFGYKASAFVARPDIYNGYGYWLASMSDATIDVAGAVHDSFASVGIPLLPGWNLIGAPFNYPVAVASIQVVDTTWWSYSDSSSWNLVSSRIWYYTDNTPDLVNNGVWDSLSPIDTAAHMMPWKGYALYAASGCSLYIQGIGSKGMPAKQVLNDYRIDWQLEITAASGQAADRGLRLGVSSQAREKYDRLDSEKPPLVSNQVKIYIPHDDWNRGPCRQYQYDFRPPADYIEWPLTVETTSDDRPAELVYNLSQTITDGYQLYLVDRKTNKTTVLTGSGKLGFSGSREFAVIYTNKGLGGLALKPLSFDLNQTYPNPFAHSITVNYQLAAAGQVSLRVYNVTGQLVRTLTEGTALPGYYSQTWNGRDNSGRKIASGVYIMRLTSGGQERTRKLVKIK